MNWWLYALLIAVWSFSALLLVGMLESIIGPMIGPLGERRTPVVEAVAVICLTAMFLGLLVVAP